MKPLKRNKKLTQEHYDILMERLAEEWELLHFLTETDAYVTASCVNLVGHDSKESKELLKQYKALRIRVAKLQNKFDELYANKVVDEYGKIIK